MGNCPAVGTFRLHLEEFYANLDFQFKFYFTKAPIIRNRTNLWYSCFSVFYFIQTLSKDYISDTSSTPFLY